MIQAILPVSLILLSEVSENKTIKLINRWMLIGFLFSHYVASYITDTSLSFITYSSILTLTSIAITFSTQGFVKMLMSVYTLFLCIIIVSIYFYIDDHSYTHSWLANNSHYLLRDITLMVSTVCTYVLSQKGSEDITNEGKVSAFILCCYILEALYFQRF